MLYIISVFYFSAVDLGLCECGAFSKSALVMGEAPIMVQHVGVRVGCGAEGAANCKKQCMKKYDVLKNGEFPNLCDGVKHLERMTVI